MKPGTRVKLEPDGRAYLVARIVGAAFVLVGYLAWLQFNPSAQIRNLYFAGAILFTLATAGSVALRLLGKHLSTRGTLLVTLPFDLAALTLLTAAAYPYEDPFYAFYVGAVAIYAALMLPVEMFQFSDDLINFEDCIVTLFRHRTVCRFAPGLDFHPHQALVAEVGIVRSWLGNDDGACTGE